ncbi:MAG: prepilin-type N-terminal cleavage/methylation domain-containing protein, partial [Dehalococcoidales bacterium]
MKRFLKRIHQGNKGFTLIELLIVIAILGVLAAVIVPNVTGFIGRGEEEAAAAEFTTVQTAMDTMMVEEGLTAVPAVLEANATKAVDTYPTGYPLYPDYLRSDETV